MTTARPAPIRYRVNTGVMTVIGVSPAGFDGLEQGWSPDAVPMMMTGMVYQSEPPFERRGHYWLGVAGRLKAGTTTQRAEVASARWQQDGIANRNRQPTQWHCLELPAWSFSLRAPTSRI
jgi:hypothetical protein